MVTTGDYNDSTSHVRSDTVIAIRRVDRRPATTGGGGRDPTASAPRLTPRPDSPRSAVEVALVERPRRREGQLPVPPPAATSVDSSCASSEESNAPELDCVHHARMEVSSAHGSRCNRACA